MIVNLFLQFKNVEIKLYFGEDPTEYEDVINISK